VYFAKPGPDNTDRTVELALKRANELNIKNIVVASNSGATAEKFLDKGLNVICVTHQVGFRNPGEDEMALETRKELSEKGVKILTTTHLLGGVGRAVRNKFGGLYPGEMVAHSLRMLGQGVKVGLEISVMALDSGLIPYGEDIIAVGGAGKGADTAIVVRPEHSQNIFSSRIKEIVCKPAS